MSIYVISTPNTIIKRFPVSATSLAVSTSTVSLWVVSGATNKRYNPSSVVVSGNEYVATFSSVALVDGFNRIKTTVESNSDIDANGLQVQTVGSSIINYTAERTLAVVSPSDNSWGANIITSTTAGGIMIRYFIKPSDTFVYTSTNTRVTISKGGITKSFNVWYNGSRYEIQLPSGGVEGYVSYGPILTWGDGVYTINVYKESVADGDTNGTVFTKIGTGSMTVVTPILTSITI